MRQQPNEVYRKMFTFPQDPRDYEILSTVDRQTRGIVSDRYDLLLDYEWVANTVANCYLETLIHTLGELLQRDPKSGLGLDFYNILRIIATIKWNNSAEKEGNINIVFEPGPTVLDMISGDVSEPITNAKVTPEIRFSVSDNTDNILYKKIEHHARYKLMSTHGITFSDSTPMAVTAISYTFIEILFRELIINGNQLDENGILSVNFNDTIEAHVTKKNDELFLNLRPGMEAKLLIKADAVTESTMGADDD